jgi:hypothetical protein
MTLEEAQEFATLDKVRKRLEEKGIHEPVKPKRGMKPISENLTDTGGDNVVEMYREYEAHYEYIAYQHAVASLKVGEWKNNLNALLAKAKKEVEKDEIETLPVVKEARKTLQIHEQEETLLGVHKSALHRRMQLLSRSVEIITKNYDASRRSSNVGLGGYGD